MCKKTKCETEETATVETETEEERSRCCVCYDSFYGRHIGLQFRYEHLICPFCAVYLAPEPRLAMVPTPANDMELLGAWSSFADDCIQWHLGISWQYRHAKIAMDALLPEALTQWALGSLWDNDSQGTALNEVWPVLAYGHILKLTEVAATLADKLHEEPDLTAIREAIARPEVVPVWQLWLAANYEHGLSEHPRDGGTMWEALGANHGQDYYARRSPEYNKKLKEGFAAARQHRESTAVEN